MKPFMFIAMLALFFGANFYVFLRLCQMAPENSWMRPALIVAGVALSLTFILYFTVGERLPSGVVTVLYRVGTSWMMLFVYLLMIVLLLDILRLFHVPGISAIMRGNWITLASVTALMLVIAWAGNINYRNKKRTYLEIETEKPLGLAGPFKIAAISDLHLGYGIGNCEIDRWVRLINAEEPDVILIGGDLIDSSVRPLERADMASGLRKLRARHGVYMIPGNHEYYAGIGPSARFAKSAGIEFLRDSVAVLPNGIQIVGRDDMTNKSRQSLSQLMAQVDTERPVILLDHQPYNLPDAESAGVDFQFSGHTHRGQIWPFSWVTDRMYEDSYGYARRGHTHYYVSSGLGIWGGKFRIGTRSEYVVVELIN